MCEFVPDTDAAFIMGLVNAIITNGWEDKEFIRTRVAGYQEMVEVAKAYTPKKWKISPVFQQVKPAALPEILAKNRTHQPYLVHGRYPAFDRFIHHPQFLYPPAGIWQYG